MEKPIKENHAEPSYDWNEIRQYIKEKYGKDLRDWCGIWEGTVDAEYQDFWHWICDHNEIHNPCHFWIFLDDENNPDPEWVKGVKAILKAEFDDEDALYCYTCW
jgi:hypothetical protein